MGLRIWVKLGVSALLALMLSGCVGALWSYGTSTTIERPAPEKDHHGSLPLNQERVAGTKSVFRQQWGAPDAIETTAAGAERWHYDRGRDWCGLALFVVVVPVPLMLPVCKVAAEVTFDGENAISMQRDSVTGNGFLCGFLLNWSDASAGNLCAK